MSRRSQTIHTFSLLIVAVAGVLALIPAPANASPGGHASISIGFGHGWHPHGRFYYRSYYPSFYFYPSAYWWGYPAPVYPAPAYPAAYENLGAVQLKVSPKKTDVYVDGRYVGRSGKYDGFPGYLWLERGNHSLVFFKDGFRTLEEGVEVRAGMITEVRLEMEPGEATEPSELFSEPPQPAEMNSTSAPPVPKPEGENPTDVAPGRTLDLRADGAQVRLDIEPAEATVYLDGRFLGTGSDLARLHGGLLVDAGQHTLDVLHPSYQAERLSFRVEAGEDLEVRVKLDRPREGSSAKKSGEASPADSGSATF